MGKSRFKRAHRTHGSPPFDNAPGSGRSAGSQTPHAQARTDDATLLFEAVCERFPNATTRASLLGVPLRLDEAWRRGERLPLLRAHRKKLRLLLEGPGRDA